MLAISRPLETATFRGGWVIGVVAVVHSWVLTVYREPVARS